MTAVDARPAATGARTSALGWGQQPRRGGRRDRKRVIAGLALVVVFAWLGAVAFLTAGHREEVLAVDGPVEKYTELTRDDLRIVRVAVDSEVPTISADEIDGVVGRTTSMELANGALLTEDQLLEADERPLGPGDAVVGALLAPADSPGKLLTGADVQVIVRSATGTTGQSRTIEGWILDVDASASAQTGTGGRWVSLVVPRSDAGQVSAAAAENRVTVVVLGGS